ncbi:hypothetical protein ACA910_001690 [Epithemia clementina (nom. ined.)]
MSLVAVHQSQPRSRLRNHEMQADEQDNLGIYNLARYDSPAEIEHRREYHGYHDTTAVEVHTGHNKRSFQAALTDDGMYESGSVQADPHESGGGYLGTVPDADSPRDAKRLKADSSFATYASAQATSTNKQWSIMFERLKAYKAKYGDCLVPKRFPEDPKLGTWVETQRVQYKRLQREFDATSGVEAVQPNRRLDQERLAKLEEIGFAWSAKHVRKSVKASTTTGPPVVPRKPVAQLGESKAASRWSDHQWEEMYQRLVRYKFVFGDCLVPRKFDQDPKLATWVETQRVLWNRDHRSAVSGGAEGRKHSASDEDHPYHDSIDPEWAVCDEATPEDADEIAAAMAEEDEVVAAAAVAAAEVVDAAARPMNKKLSRERKEKLDALGFVWSLRSKRIEDHWDQMFRQLVEYKKKQGDCLVPSRYEENLKLGKWVETQRYEYTKLQRATSDSGTSSCKEAAAAVAAAELEGKPRATNPRLTEERLRRLESIGFEWKVRNKMKRYYDKQWQDMFERLLKFKHENGHCIVPKRYPPDIKLGTWVHTQRIQYRKLGHGPKGKDGNASEGEALSDEIPKGEEMSYRLTDERRKRLEEVGFVWSARESEAKPDPQQRITRNSYDDLWDAMFERLAAFKEKHGHCLVPKRYQEDPKLGTWVDTQRVQYKKTKKIPDEKGKLQYDSDPNSTKTEDTEVINNPGEDNFAQEYTQMKPAPGRLTDERIQRLENLGFVWSLRDDWMKHYEELKLYKQEFGNCNVPARYTKNRRLGIWVSAQRQQYKILKSAGFEDAKKQRPSSLTPERIELLNQLGFTWTIRSRDSLGESWNQRFIDLKEYKEKYGNCLVPSRYPPNPELGVWVGTQRTQYRLYQKAKESGQHVNGASAMNEERIRQLEELGFVWALRGTEGNRKDSPYHEQNSSQLELEERELMEQIIAQTEI